MDISWLNKTACPTSGHGSRNAISLAFDMADILVVDDDRDVGAALVTLLELDGHTVRYAEDGLRALAVVGERLPEVICLDVDMPKLNGPEVAYRLFVEDCGREEIPIVLISGIADLMSVAELVGTPYFIGKPFALDALELLLERVLTDRCAPHPPPRKEGGVVEPRR
jgi:DNA-binding NtrC family response regulator